MIIMWVEFKEGHKRVLRLGCWISEEKEINSAQEIAGKFLGIGSKLFIFCSDFSHENMLILKLT